MGASGWPGPSWRGGSGSRAFILSRVCATTIGVSSFQMARSALCFLRPWDRVSLDGAGGGPSLVRTCCCPRLSCLSQLLWDGQGRPADEVPQILAQLLEQTAVVSSPSDLLALLGTMTYLAKVVADTSVQLNRSALEVRPLSHSRCQLGREGWELFTLGHNGPSDINVGCQVTGLFRV